MLRVDDPEAPVRLLLRCAATSRPVNGAQDLQALLSAAPKSNDEDWWHWADLSPAELPVTFGSAVDSPSALRAFAGRTASQISVCVFNAGAVPVSLGVDLRAPAGVYTVERLTVPSGCAGSTACGSLERLQGCSLYRSGTVSKSGTLNAGDLVVYRLTNRLHQADTAYETCLTRLHLVARRSPAGAARLRRMLVEAAAHLHAVQGDYHSMAGRLSHLHDLLLAGAQAQSLAKNYQIRAAMPAQQLDPVISALNTFLDAVSEMSASMLGLVPEVRILTQPAAVGAGTAQPAGEDVSVELSNTGTETVRFVKLGVHASALPTGIACTPADPALFRLLEPGQTVRARFHLQPEREVTPPTRCTADVTFLAGGGPAHLLPYSW